MIIRREDFKELSELTKGSSKKIWFICDNCGIGVLQSYKTYLKQNNGKFCRSCRNKHTSNRKDVKEKNSEFQKNRWKNEEYREKMSKSLSIGCKKSWENNIERKRILSENNPMKNPEVIEKIKEKYKNEDHPNKGRKHTKESLKKMSEIKIGENAPSWKGGYYKNNIPVYDVYAPQISWVDECRRNEDDPNILEVKCTYCGRWFIPSLQIISNRVQYLKGNNNYSGENRSYCSKGCKTQCPIYRKTPEILMKEDAFRAGRIDWIELNREVQPELRQMVFKRDDYKCIKCGSIDKLNCHHIYPVSIEPVESADIDNCIALCVECHKEVHQKDGCKYGQLKICLD